MPLLLPHGMSAAEQEELFSAMKKTLSPRESQIAELFLDGWGNRDIARILKMSPRTVKAHFNRMFLKFGVKDGVKRVKLARLLYWRQRQV